MISLSTAEKKEKTLATLKEQVREAARIAEEQSMDKEFNAMTWLDLILEDTPQFFDSLFDRPWDELSENEQQERTVEIRRVL